MYMWLSNRLIHVHMTLIGVCVSNLACLTCPLLNFLSPDSQWLFFVSVKNRSEWPIYNFLFVSSDETNLTSFWLTVKLMSLAPVPSTLEEVVVNFVVKLSKRHRVKDGSVTLHLNFDGLWPSVKCNFLYSKSRVGNVSRSRTEGRCATCAFSFELL